MQIITSSQLVNVKNVGEKLSLFCVACRSLIISTLHIHQNSNELNPQQLEILIHRYASDSDSITFNEDLGTTDNNRRIQYARLIAASFKRANKLRLKICALN